MEIGDRVYAVITKNGYWVNEYKGTIAGFTANGRVKVSDNYKIRVHAQQNVTLIKKDA